MKILTKILAIAFVLIGCFSVYIGMDAAMGGASTRGEISTLSIVIGGGLFMALGVAIHILNRS